MLISVTFSLNPHSNPMRVFVLEIEEFRNSKSSQVSIKCWAVCKIQKYKIYVIMLITVDINSTEWENRLLRKCITNNLLNTGIPCFIELCRYYVFYKLKICGSYVKQVYWHHFFPIPFAYFLSLCHILIMCARLQTFSS